MTMTAQIVSPQSASGIPIAATSLTPGYEASTASISAGDTNSPPVRMVSALRPATVTTPSSTSTRSPVSNHPSRITRLVSSGKQ
jgi:hypothetical protein